MLPITEQENPRTANIDQVSTLDALRLINNEDKLVAEAVERVLPEAARAADEIVERLRNGGRLFYTGTGTSGRSIGPSSSLSSSSGSVSRSGFGSSGRSSAS